jgi:CheY-like chemotaxis protein
LADPAACYPLDGLHAPEYGGPLKEERRRDVRVSPKGTILIRGGPHILRGRIANVSRGGVMVSTRDTAPESGTPVELAARLDSREAIWFELRGRVLRVAGSSIAIALDGVPASFAAIIAETVSASQDNERLLSILLVDATLERRLAMAEAFRAAGCAVIDVSTPLEAIVRLGESDFEPNLVAIADSLPSAISDELRHFVDADHPYTKLVTIGDGESAPDGLAHWLSSANPSNDLASRIRSVLTTFRS